MTKRVCASCTDEIHPSNFAFELVDGRLFCGGCTRDALEGRYMSEIIRLEKLTAFMRENGLRRLAIADISLERP